MIPLALAQSPLWPVLFIFGCALFAGYLLRKAGRN